MKIPTNLQSLYSGFIKTLQTPFTLKKENDMQTKGVMKGEKKRWSAVAMVAILSFTLLPSPLTSRAYAWSWDEDESGTKDELDIQLEGYRKRVEQGISLQERIVLLDRLIKLYKVRKRDSKALEEERAQVLADDQAVQTVSAAVPAEITIPFPAGL